MSELIRIAGRNEEAGAAVFQAIHVDGSAGRDDDLFCDLRLGDESVAIIDVDCRIDPRVERFEIAGRLVEKEPVDVLARAMDACHRLLDETDDGSAAEGCDVEDRQSCLSGQARLPVLHAPILFLHRLGQLRNGGFAVN